MSACAGAGYVSRILLFLLWASSGRPRTPEPIYAPLCESVQLYDCSINYFLNCSILMQHTTREKISVSSCRQKVERDGLGSQERERCAYTMEVLLPFPLSTSMICSQSPLEISHLCNASVDFSLSF